MDLYLYLCIYIIKYLFKANADVWEIDIYYF